MARGCTRQPADTSSHIGHTPCEVSRVLPVGKGTLQRLNYQGAGPEPH